MGNQELIDEAKRRGFVIGAEFISPSNPKVQKVEQEPYFYGGGSHDGIAVKDQEGVIYYEGKWATLVEEENKEPIAYILKDNKYLQAVEAITHLSLLDYTSEDTVRTENNISGQTLSYQRLKEAKVLDLWFEPVYDKSFKVGDIVVLTSNKNTRSNGKYSNNRDVPVGVPLKIKDCSQSCFGANTKWIEFEGYEHGISSNQVRKATAEEIEEYLNKKELPEINGYLGVDKGDYIKYGCASLPKVWFEKGADRYIIEITLNTGVKISAEQTEQIRNYLNSK